MTMSRFASKATAAPAMLLTAGALIFLAGSELRAQTSRPEPEFDGRLLVVASDGDMQAQAYAGDVLGPPARDTLSLIQLGTPGTPAVVGSVDVPNSVVGPPASLSVTPDGQYAIVVETRGPRPPGRPDARLKDLPTGRAITVIDLRNPARPLVVQRLTGRANPISVATRRDGRVAIAYDTSTTKGVPLDLYDFVDGRLSGPRSPSLPGFAADDMLKNAAFTPGGELALVYASHPRLSLLRFGAGERLARWGNDVPLGRMPFEVCFTPDGRFALVNDMYVPTEGSDVRGTVTSIAIADGRAPDGTPRHHVVSQARTGVMPEGLAISPNAHWVATTNLERTAYRTNDSRQGFFASVTLFRLDPRTGQLARVGEYPFNGVIPEAAAFDDSSQFLAVTSFDHFGPRQSRGSVDFWRIVGDFQDPARAELAPTGISVPIARGAQSMEIVR